MCFALYFRDLSGFCVENGLDLEAKGELGRLIRNTARGEDQPSSGSGVEVLDSGANLGAGPVK